MVLEVIYYGSFQKVQCIKTFVTINNNQEKADINIFDDKEKFPKLLQDSVVFLNDNTTSVSNAHKKTQSYNFPY